jgi:hypothetical protein
VTNSSDKRSTTGGSTNRCNKAAGASSRGGGVVGSNTDGCGKVAGIVRAVGEVEEGGTWCQRRRRKETSPEKR